MNRVGMLLASRYAYPPNSLSLCGPEKQTDLAWYSGNLTVDLGTKELLEQFGTLYPYLKLIAAENNRKDPFDPEVVEAYWIGNALLKNVGLSPFMKHLTDDLQLAKKVPKKTLLSIAQHIDTGGLPFHNFHVLAIYRRTGNIPDVHTIRTMDACIINFGKVLNKTEETLTVLTKPIISTNGILLWGKPIRRHLSTQGVHDRLAADIKPGDWISYHWGQFCESLSPRKLRNLKQYMTSTLSVLNSHIWQDSSVFSVHK